MAFSFVGSATGTKGTGHDTVIAVPTGTTDGDLMISCMWNTGDDAQDVHADWTLIGVYSPAGDDIQMQYRYASSEPGSYTFHDAGGGSGAESLGYICTYRGITTFSAGVAGDTVVSSAGPPHSLATGTDTNAVGAEKLLVHRAFMAQTKFGTNIDFTDDAALSQRASVNLNGIQELHAVDEIWEDAADFPSRSLTVTSFTTQALSLIVTCVPDDVQGIASGGSDHWGWSEEELDSWQTI